MDLDRNAVHVCKCYRNKIYIINTFFKHLLEPSTETSSFSVTLSLKKTASLLLSNANSFSTRNDLVAQTIVKCTGFCNIYILQVKQNKDN